MAKCNPKHKAVIGGAAPDHFIKVPDFDGSLEETEEQLVRFIEDTMKDFVGENKTKLLAVEEKLATLTFSGRPQISL